MARVWGVLVLGWVLGAGGVLVSEPLPDGGITLNEMAKILSDKGYKAEIKVAKDDKDETRIVSAAEGHVFVIYFYGFSDDGRAKNIQYCISFNPISSITVERSVEWNRHFRFARMYLNDSNTSYWEMDRDLEHGATTEAIDNDLERWFSVIHSIDKFISDKDDKSKV